MTTADRLSRSHTAATPDRRQVATGFACVVIFTILAFLPVLRADFVTWDDNRNFLGNPDYRGLGLEQLRWMWTTTLMGHYVPLTWMSLGADYALWGMNPVGYHATNLALHALNAGLMFALALVLLRGVDSDSGGNRVVPAAVAALVFSIHPLRVESVAWVTERRDVLSMAFYLASILSYLRAVTRPPGRRWHAVALGMFVCALLSKASAVTLPAVLVLLNAYPLRRLESRANRIAVAKEIFPFAVLSMAAGVLSLLVLHPPAQLTIAEKIAVSAYSFAFYLWKTVVPLSLAPLYPMPVRLDLLRPAFVLSYAVCIAYAAIAFIVRRKNRGLAVGMLAFVVILLPLLGIVQNGPQIAADRYTYQASVALALLGGALLIRFRDRLFHLGCLAILAWWAALTWKQCGIWKDSDRLWSRVLRVDSTSVVGLFALGDVRIAQNRHDEALALYERAVRIDTGYAEGHNNLGVLYAKRGNYDLAIREHRAAIQIQPKLAEAYANLGVALAAVGQDSAAIPELEHALSLRPDLVDAEINWGNILVRQGRARSAISHYERAIRLSPRNAGAHLNLGVALAQTSDFAKAALEFEQALTIDPRLDDARTYLQEARRRMTGVKPP